MRAIDRKWYRYGALTLAVGLLAGCGGKATPAPSGTAAGAKAGATASATGGGGAVTGVHRACSLLTAQEAQHILGTAVDAGKPGDIPYDNCVYSTTSGKTIATVGLTIYPGTTSSTLFKQYQTQGHKLNDLSGVGDKASAESDGRLVIAVKDDVGCAVTRTGEVKDASASTLLLKGICLKVFAAR